jgi:ankyrin repeat protein
MTRIILSVALLLSLAAFTACTKAGRAPGTASRNNNASGNQNRGTNEPAPIEIALITAARNGDNATVKSMLDQGVNVNARGTDGRTPIMEAAYEGHVDTVRMLMDRGAYLSLKKTDGAAAEGLGSGHKDIVELFKNANAAIEAASKGDDESLKTLLDKKTPVNVFDQNGHSALTEAAWNGRTGTVKLLLSRGADPSLKKPDGATALELAKGQKQQEVADLLQQAVAAKSQSAEAAPSAGEKTAASPSPTKVH